VDFSKARDLFEIIFQIPGSDCKFLDCGLILEKSRGLNAKCPKLDFSVIIFLKETRGPSPQVRGPPEPRSTVDRSWTAAPSSPGLRPPAAPGSMGVGQGAGEGEWGAGSAVWRLGITAAWWRSKKISGEAFRRGRGERRSVVRCGVLRGSSGWLL
jgi:hypothetical protein